MQKYLFLLFLGIPLLLDAQSPTRRALQHDDIAQWNTIERPKISNDGRWVVYVLRPIEGDTELKVYDGQQQTTRTFPRGEAAALSADSRFVVFSIKPHRDSLLKLRRKKTKREDLPKDSLGILNLESNQLVKVPAVKSFVVPEKWSGWLVYQREPAKYAPKDSSRVAKKKENEENGSALVLYNLSDGRSTVVEYVKGYVAAEEQARLAWHTTGNGSDQAPGVYYFDGSTGQTQQVFTGKGQFKQLALDRKGLQLAFLANFDSTKLTIRPYALYHWKLGPTPAKPVLSPGASFLPAEWLVSDNGAVSFSKDGTKLFFGIAPKPMLPDTNLLEDEMVSVEVWSTADPRIYPQQKVQLEQEKRRTYSCVYHPATGKLVQLGTPDVPEIRIGNEGNASQVLGFTDRPYAIESTWKGGSARDLYLIDVLSGQRQLIARRVEGNPSWSPEAKYVYWYAENDSTWMAYAVAKKELLRLTTNQKVAFYDEENDLPDYPRPYGLAGWTTEDDFVMIYDRYDIWLIDPKKQLAPTNLTNSRADKTIMRYLRTNPEERAIEEVKPLLLHAVREKDLYEAYLWYEIHTGSKKIQQQGPFSLSTNVLKAKNADRWVFTREDFATFPDLLYGSDLARGQRISEANPQQASFHWGTNELVEWTAADGQQLRGMLMKPADFDPNRQYPMVVYFYERMSQQLFDHWAPDWNRSRISFPAFVSRGYLVFVPDIPYRIGYPGESARNAIVSGVTALINRGFVDKANIGLQGHSWGGYQIAYLVTQTNLFKCAESGAPVVNMVSAYGGIRWESGVSRQFQYEHTQSRIGGTLWEKPLRYLENSPIFFVDKIATPLLIMHNDKDGAVPWYQGIEFYMALRRLGKPAWLLNYNDEGHGLVQLRNRKDFQMRMAQFFDHYLKGAPQPQWMANGIPALLKGIKTGYEY